MLSANAQSSLNPEESAIKAQPQVKYRQTCDACQAIKTRCSRDQPACQRCQTQRIQCHYGVSRRIGRPRRLAQTSSPSPPAPRQEEDIAVPSRATEDSSNPGLSASSVSRAYTVDWDVVDMDVDSDGMVVDVRISRSFIKELTFTVCVSLFSYFG